MTDLILEPGGEDPRADALPSPCDSLGASAQGARLPILHTTSSLSTWDQCKRLYRYKYKDLVRPVRKGKALSVGTATHDGLEAFASGASLPDILALVAERATRLSWTGDEAAVELSRVRAMLAAYYATWAETRDNWESVEIEGLFRTAGGFGGKRDALMRYRPTGRLYLKENKTTSDEIATVGADYWQRLLLDRQLAIYQRTAEEQAGEEVSILYDVIRKPGGAPKLKQSISRRKNETDEQVAARKAEARETLGEFETRMIETMLASPGDFLVRREVHRTREQVDEIWAEMRETAAEIDNYTGRFPRNDGACRNRFGTCAFLGVCTGTETLDSERFEKLEVAHPELAEETNNTSEDTDGSQHSSTELPF